MLSFYKLLVLRKWRKDYTGFLCIISYICMWTYNYFYNMSSKIISFKTVILRVNLWFHLRFSSVQFSCSVMSDSLRHHGPQHARPPCPSPAPRVHPNSCPLSWWCHPTISSSVVLFSSCPQSFPASGSFKWIRSSHQVARVLEFQLQHQSFQWIFRTDLL